MLTPRTTLARRVTAALDASPSRIPVLVGGCGSGRTTVLRQLRERLGRTAVQHIDVERTATTPERFLRAVTAVSPFPVSDPSAQAAGARAGVRRDARVLRARAHVGQRAGDVPPRRVPRAADVRELPRPAPRAARLRSTASPASGNRFVLTSRYVARTLRLLRDQSARFEVIHMPPLTAEDTADILGPTAAPGGGDNDAHDADYLARTVQALADGRPAYVRALADELAALREHGGPGGGDAISALAGLLATDGPPREAVRVQLRAAAAPRPRLRRAQGDSRDPRRRRRADAHRDLAAAAADARVDEGLPVVARGRRPRDVAAEALHASPIRCCASGCACTAAPSAPTEDDLAREVHRYALPRLPQQTEPPAPPPPAEPAFAMAGGPPSGIIEID